MNYDKVKAWNYTTGWGSIENQVTNELNEYVKKLDDNNIKYDIIVTPKKNGAIYSVIIKNEEC